MLKKWETAPRSSAPTIGRMATKQTDITRHSLARIHGLRTTVVFGAALLVICFQRPLGIGPEGIVTLQWLVCASFLLDLPITRFYFP
ncbi:MAG: hypothetical protein QOJ98_3374, partial [Acidobacteriota bacterium]|nr:hypothetical protein [Acidobacteriota bacterium]